MIPYMPSKWIPGERPQKTINGKVDRLYRHIAEKALGHPLPPKAEIHHVDGDPLNNEPSNLVICEDRAYHLLLHKICSKCKKLLERDKFSKSRRGKAGCGLANECKDCNKSRWNTEEYRAKRRKYGNVYRRYDSI